MAKPSTEVPATVPSPSRSEFHERAQVVGVAGELDEVRQREAARPRR